MKSQPAHREYLTVVGKQMNLAVTSDMDEEDRFEQIKEAMIEKLEKERDPAMATVFKKRTRTAWLRWLRFEAKNAVDDSLN
jgi:hypothetical protein